MVTSREFLILDEQVFSVLFAVNVAEKGVKHRCSCKLYKRQSTVQPLISHRAPVRRFLKCL